MKKIKYLRLQETGEDLTGKNTLEVYIKGFGKNSVVVKKEQLSPVDSVANTTLLKTIIAENTATQTEPLIIVLPNIDIPIVFDNKYSLPQNVYLMVENVNGVEQPYIYRAKSTHSGVDLATVIISEGKLIPCVTLYEQEPNPAIADTTGVPLRRQVLDIEANCISKCKQSIIGKPYGSSLQLHEALLIKNDTITKLLLENKIFYGAVTYFNGVGSKLTDSEVKTNLQIVNCELNGFIRLMQPFAKRDNSLNVIPNQFYLPWITKESKIPKMVIHFKQPISWGKLEYAQFNSTLNTTGFIGLTETSKIAGMLMTDFEFGTPFSVEQALSEFKDCIFDYPTVFHSEIRTITHTTYGKARVIIQWLEADTTKQIGRHKLVEAYGPTKQEIQEYILSKEDKVW